MKYELVWSKDACVRDLLTYMYTPTNMKYVHDACMII